MSRSERDGGRPVKKPLILDAATALRGQALLRLGLGGAIIVIGLALVDLLHMRLPYELPMGGLYIAYAAIVYLIASRRRFLFPSRASYVTAWLDSAMLTGWILVSGRVGQLIVPFYIFTAIGYGMRTGSKRIMHVSQLASVLGLALAPLVPYWRENIAFWLSSMVSIVIIPGYVSILMDKLHRALRFAESESKAKSDLLARVSHELRTPLSGISSAAELIEAEAKEERPRRLAKTILALSVHLLADINDLLDQSKASLGKLELDNEPIEVDRLVAVVSASVEMRARQKSLSYSTVIDPRITDRVIGDPHWLARVLINLLGNAVKFTDFGSVSLEVSLLQESQDAYLMRFSVRDTGVGIAREYQEKIFDPFVQIKGQGAAQFEGAGLGLAISKQVVELMGGALRVRADVGMGSNFWFDLQMMRAPARPSVVDEPDSVLPPTELHGQRLLVVDDNETNRYLLQELLQREGHEVVTAATGEQALDLLSREPRFDLLLLDYNLGAMDGSMVLQAYRFGTRNPSPAYFLTADATLVTASKLRDTGALGVLTKPVRLHELRRAIQAASGGVQAQAAEPGEFSFEERTQRPTGPAGPAQSHLRPVPVVFVDMAVIDRLRSIGTRQVFVKELLERALADIDANTLNILAALERGDLKAARDAGHALKGVCMETGAMRLMNMALGVMRTKDNYLLEDRARIAAELQDTSQRTRDALQRIIADTMRQAAGF
ncbi:ATP-binding protein [Thiomonas sp.]|uniref:ATP-binding protein n=1 Tax=Thiomonas sp. TaxID=2047785 RepID=UPI00260E1C4F|nr:ATP-binding protein [Thiomonas sp.]